LPWDKVKPARYYPASAPIDIFELARQEHEKRIKNDELFQLLIDDIELKREASQKKEISLLETRRKQEREKLVAAKKEIQNAMRAAKGLPPLTDEEIDAAEEDDVEKEDEPLDILLQETAEILHDLIVPPSKQSVDTRTVEAQIQATAREHNM
ncbi:MAG: carboxy terminal-processing peptidase, partial [Gammaproteobacteria bacterium]